MNTTPLLHMSAISKSFPGVKALDRVDFTVQPGEIMALLGENGAGKSTLMRILDGVFTPDSGQIFWRGQPVQIRSPQDAKNLGISMIHQELALVPYLDVAKNIYLGREPAGLLPGTIDWTTLYEQAHQQLARLDLDVDPRTPVRDLPLAQQQMVEVAKALSLSAQLIVMDEPTSSLSNAEVAVLFRTMRALKEQGVSIVFISHRLNEIFAIADRVTVLRDGSLVGSEPLQGMTADALIRMMVGRELGETNQRPAGEDVQSQRQPILEVRNLSRAGILHDINFTLYEGEILGVAGLVGAGRTELAETIFSVHPPTQGDILLRGQKLRLRRPADAIRAGIALVTEDRKGQGLFLRMEVGANISVRILHQLARFGLIRWRDSQHLAQEYVDKLGVRTPSVRQKVRNLSGGNQQKVVIAKWLTLKPQVLILDEPTRGIDVGAKGEIHRLMRELASQGVGILMISSELPEVLGVSDRVLVMRGGRVVAEMNPRLATQDDIMRAATGAKTS
ncbi:MAG: sugar ABC transporter ATP-binding protein [Anaerolineae bacterium]|nr:sugar ABC transporter ATP-binding protein [Anaerolineae bacterium]MDW8171991.1 sugar ABC transporter ATP-binding protein [Anaerolineae bacterium]